MVGGDRGDRFADVVHRVAGEHRLVLFDQAGRPSFTALAERMHVRNAVKAARLAATVPVTYMIFDVLRLGGQDLTGWIPVQVAPNTFTVRDGMIVTTGIPTSDQLSRRRVSATLNGNQLESSGNVFLIQRKGVKNSVWVYSGKGRQRADAAYNVVQQFYIVLAAKSKRF